MLEGLNLVTFKDTSEIASDFSRAGSGISDEFRLAARLSRLFSTRILSFADIPFWICVRRQRKRLANSISLFVQRYSITFPRQLTEHSMAYGRY